MSLILPNVKLPRKPLVWVLRRSSWMFTREPAFQPKLAGSSRFTLLLIVGIPPEVLLKVTVMPPPDGVETTTEGTSRWKLLCVLLACRSIETQSLIFQLKPGFTP